MQYLKLSLHKQAILRLDQNSGGILEQSTSNIYENVAEDHRVDRVIGFGPRTPPPPFPPEGKFRGGTHSLAGEGVGGVPIRTMGQTRWNSR